MKNSAFVTVALTTALSAFAFAPATFAGPAEDDAAISAVSDANASHYKALHKMAKSQASGLPGDKDEALKASRLQEKDDKTAVDALSAKKKADDNKSFQDNKKDSNEF